MSKKKEKLLKKYLDKKRKQRKRDDLLAQIAAIEQSRVKSASECDVTKRKKIDTEISEDENNDEIENNEESDNEEIDKSDNDDSDKSDNEKTDYYDNEESDKSEDDESDKLDNEESDIEDKLEDSDNNLNNIQIAEPIPIYEKYIENKSDTKSILEIPIDPEISDNESSINSELDLEDFLGEKVHWEIVECPHRPPDLEEFRKTLPIYYEKSDIISKIRNNTVISIRGETGCGKTTQIPQFLYEGGFKRLIGVTQPRRISTISISNRINAEMGENISGYQIRYDSSVTPNTKIKIMTDGILLKKIQSDFLLSKYSVILLDEIHERSANMDILISLLSRIVKIRKQRNDELKIVLMSATSMVDELSKFFDKISTIEVPANSHRVSIFYEDKDPEDIVQASYDRISKIIKAKKDQVCDSVLCFLPDKNDIYSLYTKLSERFPDCVILPLHSSLSKQEQNLIYKEYDQRKIILATNIAETSITIPDVFYVVDSGLVKQKYLGLMNTVEYSVEFISKSSALQRAGRAGRTGPGLCYRLYTGNTYSKFDELNTPKILHESLDEILLDLISLGIKDVYKFPFLNRPADESIKKSIFDLKRIGILNSSCALTKLGKYVSGLPLPPRISKMLCIPNTNHLLPELIDLTCIMASDIEIRRNGCNKNYYISEKSDFLVILKIFRDFEKDKNKKDYCKRMGVNLSVFNEILKLQKFMYNKFNIKPDQKNVINDEIKNELRKIIYSVYLDRVALPYDTSYWYKKNPVYLSDSSVETDGEYVIFEYLIRGKKRLYMKNITIIDKEWIS